MNFWTQMLIHCRANTPSSKLNKTPVLELMTVCGSNAIRDQNIGGGVDKLII